MHKPDVIRIYKETHTQKNRKDFSYSFPFYLVLKSRERKKQGTIDNVNFSENLTQMVSLGLPFAFFKMNVRSTLNVLLCVYSFFLCASSFLPFLPLLKYEIHTVEP